MTLKDVLEKMGIKLDAKVDETPDMSKLEEMEKQIEELSQKISGSTVEQKNDKTDDNKEDNSDMETIQKLQAQIKELQDANRALLDGTQQEEEKSIEENMFELYKIAKGGITDASDNT